MKETFWWQAIRKKYIYSCIAQLNGKNLTTILFQYIYSYLSFQVKYKINEMADFLMIFLSISDGILHY